MAFGAPTIEADMYDGETGLPTRALLVDRLSVATSRCERTGTAVSLLLVRVGEDPVAAATLLTTVVRAGDTVARITDDELGVIVDDLLDPAEAVGIGRRLLAALAAHEVAIGITVADSRRDPEELLGEAGSALTRAIRGHGCEVFAPDLGNRATARARSEAEMARAIAGGELLLHYQPIVDLADGTVHGVEALVRWEHPHSGLLGPGEFLADAESSGAIVALGAWVLRDACRQVAAWHASRGGQRGFVPFWLSVNASARQLAHPAFPDAVDAALTESGLPPGLLCLEVSETDLAMLGDAGVAALRRMRTTGVRIAVDDATSSWDVRSHGVGVDVLKAAPDHIHAVLATRGPDVEVVAAQIEAREQEVSVRRAGGRLAQGFLYARPTPAAEIEVLLDLLGEPISLVSPRAQEGAGDAEHDAGPIASSPLG